MGATTVSPRVDRLPEAVKEGVARRSNSFCKKCGMPAEYSVQVIVRKRGRAGRKPGGNVKMPGTGNVLLCEACTSMLIKWPRT